MIQIRRADENHAFPRNDKNCALVLGMDERDRLLDRQDLFRKNKMTAAQRPQVLLFLRLMTARVPMDRVSLVSVSCKVAPLTNPWSSRLTETASV